MFETNEDAQNTIAAVEALTSPSDFLFAISRNEEDGDDTDYYICMTPQLIWEGAGCQYDQEISFIPPIEKICEELGLDEVTESTFQPDHDVDLETMKQQQLIATGLVYSEAFQAFIDEHS